MKHFLRFSIAATAVLALGWRGATPVSGQQPPPAAALNDSLRRLAELETAIDRARELERAERERLRRAGEALDATTASLRARAATGDQAREFLERSLKSRGEQGGEDILRAAGERAAADKARRLSMQTAGVLAWQADERESDAAVLAALAVLSARQRDAARVAAGRADRLEAQGRGADEALGEVAAGARYYSAFQELSLAQLRERQQALVDEVAAVRRTYEDQATETARLGAQRDELNALVKRLGESPDPTPGVQAPATPQAVVPAFVPSVEVGSGNPPLEAVPYEDDPVPSVSTTGVGAEGVQAGEAGPRRLFWHASPVEVRAPAGGKVVFSGGFAGYRHLLIVDLGSGWHLLFGNLSICLLKAGDTLAAGAAAGTYQAAQGFRAEPFWIETRRGVEALPPEQCPLLPAEWQKMLFR